MIINEIDYGRDFIAMTKNSNYSVLNVCKQG
jgi:hypothetical protein